MTRLRQKLNELRDVRAKATKGHFETIRMDESSGYFSFMVEAPDADDHIIGHFCEIDNPKAKRNAEFLECAANEWDALIDTCEKLLKVAEFYGAGAGLELRDEGRDYNVQYVAYENNFDEPYVDGIEKPVGHFARETLASLQIERVK